MSAPRPSTKRRARKSRGDVIDSPVGRFSLLSVSSLHGDESVLPVAQLRALFPQAMVVEPAPQAALPLYAERQVLRLALSATRRAPDCLVYTDPAHSAFVVSWRTADTGVLLEYRIPGSEQALERALDEERLLGGRSRAERKRSGAPRIPEPEGGGSAALGFLAKRFGVSARKGESAREGESAANGAPVGKGKSAGKGDSAATSGSAAKGESRRDLLVSRVEAFEDVDELRSAWRALDELRVLDMDSGDDGRWLLDASRALEPIYLAVNSRTRSFVQDALASGKHRPEFLKDLRKRLDLLESRAGLAGPRCTLRRVLLRQNLFGLGRSPRDARSLRRVLAGYAELTLGPAAYLDLNVSCSDAPGCRSAAKSEPSERLRENRPASIEPRGSTDIRALRLAWAIGRSRRGTELQNDVDDRRAAIQLEKRRRELMRCESILAANQDGLEAMTAAAFPWTAGDSFQVIREEGSP